MKLIKDVIIWEGYWHMGVGAIIPLNRINGIYSSSSDQGTPSCYYFANAVQEQASCIVEC